jgi:primosomal protein N' (replication factor Y)
VPLRKEIRAEKVELIGTTMTRHVAAALDRGEQVILLMNRRGFASYVFAPSSGWIMTCEHCDRPMVYHRASEMAMCHHCGLTADVPAACPVSGGKLVLFGYGIQRIEGEIGRKFPGARLARMDSDTMTSSKQFDEVLGRFAAGELDILLGTQMVAKGLDFPRVSLVGVASADTALTIPDFRASERTFQLIVQVAGRAGRSDLAGEVIVQTLQPDEPAIECAVNHDYDGFAGFELPHRQDAGLPPFTRMVRFIVRHHRPERAEAGARKLTGDLRQLLPSREVALMGPMMAGIRKIREHYRWHVLAICRRPGAMQQALHSRMGKLLRDNPAEVFADVDPMQLA